MLTEVGGCHSSHTESHTLHRIAAYGGIHRSKIEFTIFRRRYISRYKSHYHLFGPIEKRHFAQTHQHTLYGILILLYRHLSVLLPELIGHKFGIGGYNLFTLFIKHIYILRCVEVMICIRCHAPCIKTLSAFHYLEFHRHIVLHFQPRSIGCPLKILNYGDALHIIKINRLGNIQFHSLYEQRGIIERNIYTPEKTERLGGKWREAKLYALHALHIDGVAEIIFVIVHTDFRQWADKAVLHHRNIVAEYVNLSEYIFKETLHTLLVERFINACTLGASHYLLFTLRRASIVIVAHLLLNRNSEYWLS